MSDVPVDVTVMCRDREEAVEISKLLVEQRLAACCNLGQEVLSVYRWEGAVETTSEITLHAKTIQRALSRLFEAVQRMHSYDVPAITAHEIGGITPDYAAWLDENVA